VTFRLFRPATPAPAAEEIVVPTPAPTEVPAEPVRIDPVIEAAHIALHSIWAMPNEAEPTGHGCKGCVPDLTVVFGPLTQFAKPGIIPPAWAMVQAARALHNAWSAAPIEVGSTAMCADCMDDVSVVMARLTALTPVLAPAA
jgi:hypothetical protein